MTCRPPPTVEIHLRRRRLAVASPLSIAASIERVRTPPPPLNVFDHRGRRQVAASGGRGRRLMMAVVGVVGVAAAAGVGC
jgi:hypothetical protein